jgi:LPXTG-motif cell wall-anchored protein
LGAGPTTKHISGQGVPGIGVIGVAAALAAGLVLIRRRPR